MSTQTPSAPSAPVATALSPVLWQVYKFLFDLTLILLDLYSGIDVSFYFDPAMFDQLNLPDRFDIYSTGLIFLQMVTN